jgi:hypothetical protein
MEFRWRYRGDTDLLALSYGLCQITARTVGAPGCDLTTRSTATLIQRRLNARRSVRVIADVSGQEWAHRYSYPQLY